MSLKGVFMFLNEHLPPARLLVKAPAVPAHSTQPCHQQKDCLSQPGSTQQGKPQETALDASPGYTVQARNHSTNGGHQRFCRGQTSRASGYH